MATIAIRMQVTACPRAACVITPNDGIGATGCTTMMPYMTRFQSVSERRKCGALVDDVGVGEVDMGLASHTLGAVEAPQDGKEALEVEFHSQLDDARLVRRLDLSERIAGRIQVEVLKVRLVEDVESFDPELHSSPFRQLQVLEEREVPTGESRSRDSSATLDPRQQAGRIRVEDTVVLILHPVICGMRRVGVGIRNLI